jgi:alpha-tubulin suppressor-like RCC1 family protein
VVSIGHGIALKSDGTVTTWGANFYGETNVPPGLNNVVAIASSGGPNRLALRADGTVAAWGDNSYGQANVPPALKNVVAIASGHWHHVALRADGTVAAWGANFSGQTNVPPNLSNVVAIAAGGFRSLALKADGTVAGWGQDSGSSGGVSNLAAIAIGHGHNLGLEPDGTLWFWGTDIYGVMGKPAWLSNAVAVAAGVYHSVVLRANRGPNATPRSVTGVANHDLVIDLAGSDPDGDALSFRVTTLPALGQLYQSTNGNRGAAITAANTWLTGGSRVIFAPSTNGFANNYAAFSFVVSDGEAESAPASVAISISANTYAATLAASSVTTNAARLNGMAVAGGLPTLAWFEWGGTNAPFSQATTPVPVVGGANVVHLTATLIGLSPGAEYRFRLVVSNAARIAIGAEHRFKTGGKIATWGQNIYNLIAPPPGLANAVSSAGGGTHSLALLTDGTVKAWGGGDPYYGSAQTNVPPGLNDVVAVAAGTFHSVALRSNGTVRAWGGYLYYLGAETNVPANLSNVIAIAAGDGYSLALKNDGRIATWGRSGSSVPPGLSNMVAIAAGGGHNLALRIDGTVVAWGNNSAGQATVPFGLSNVTAIAAGQSHSMALRANGTVATWGFISGEANMPANLSNVVSIAAGHNHRLALKPDGTIVGWGNNNYGQLNIPANLGGVVQLAGGAGHTLALDGNVPPSALNKQVVAYPNHDVIIPLSGVDANGDPLTLHMNPPTRGAAYQFESGGRGAPMVVPGLVTDPLGRVVFAPEPDQFGNPNPTFRYSANDGEASSPQATVTISVILPSAPRFDLRNSGWTTNGAFELNFTGQSNATYSVHVSTNLVDWDKLGFAAPVTPSVFRFSDPFTNRWPLRFYRAGAP